MSIIDFSTLLASTAAFIGAVVNIIGLRRVKQELNGRMTELLELTRKAARAEGVKEELERERERERGKGT